jgi:Phage integrase family
LPEPHDVLQSVPRKMDNPNVFHQRGKSPRRFGWVRTDFDKARQAAGLAGTRFHDLRHTAATQLRRLGRDLQVVQQLLGHKAIRTTMRYSHVHPTELREAVNKLGEKIMPSGAGHFTITSQSAEGATGVQAAQSENESRIQTNQVDGVSGMEPMPKTVNLMDTSSQEQELADPPSSS